MSEETVAATTPTSRAEATQQLKQHEQKLLSKAPPKTYAEIQAYKQRHRELKAQQTGVIRSETAAKNIAQQRGGVVGATQRVEVEGVGGKYATAVKVGKETVLVTTIGGKPAVLEPISREPVEKVPPPYREERRATLITEYKTGEIQFDVARKIKDPFITARERAAKPVPISGLPIPPKRVREISEEVKFAPKAVSPALRGLAITEPGARMGAEGRVTYPFVEKVKEEREVAFKKIVGEAMRTSEELESFLGVQRETQAEMLKRRVPGGIPAELELAFGGLGRRTVKGVYGIGESVVLAGAAAYYKPKETAMALGIPVGTVEEREAIKKAMRESYALQAAAIAERPLETAAEIAGPLILLGGPTAVRIARAPVVKPTAPEITLPKPTAPEITLPKPTGPVVRETVLSATVVEPTAAGKIGVAEIGLRAKDVFIKPARRVPAKPEIFLEGAEPAKVITPEIIEVGERVAVKVAKPAKPAKPPSVVELDPMKILEEPKIKPVPPSEKIYPVRGFRRIRGEELTPPERKVTVEAAEFPPEPEVPLVEGAKLVDVKLATKISYKTGLLRPRKVEAIRAKDVTGVFKEEAPRVPSWEAADITKVEVGKKPHLVTPKEYDATIRRLHFKGKPVYEVAPEFEPKVPKPTGLKLEEPKQLEIGYRKGVERDLLRYLEAVEPEEYYFKFKRAPEKPTVGPPIISPRALGGPGYPAERVILGRGRLEQPPSVVMREIQLERGIGDVELYGRMPGIKREPIPEFRDLFKVKPIVEQLPEITPRQRYLDITTDITTTEIVEKFKLAETTAEKTVELIAPKEPPYIPRPPPDAFPRLPRRFGFAFPSDARYPSFMFPTVKPRRRRRRVKRDITPRAGLWMINITEFEKFAKGERPFKARRLPKTPAIKREFIRAWGRGPTMVMGFPTPEMLEKRKRGKRKKGRRGLVDLL